MHCWWDCKSVQPLQKTVWSFLKILKIKIPYDPAIPLLGVYPKKSKHKYVPVCLLQCFHNSQDMETTQVALSRQLDEQVPLYVYTIGYYSATENKPFAPTWVDLQIVMLSGISQTQKDKYHRISLICRI